MSALVPRCGTCNALFDSVEAVRRHYESEFHLHNVRLRVEGTRPLTMHEFKQFRDATGAPGDDGRPSFACKLCKKTFHSVQTLQSHVRSTAHLMQKEQRLLARDSEAASAWTSTSLGSAAMGLHRRHKAKRVPPPLRSPKAETSRAKVPIAEREEDVSAVRCLFCGRLAPDVAANLHHLRRAHAFSIPLEEKCVDVEGLLAYLARKVNGLLCLVCGADTRVFGSLDALRAHMRECNHERLLLGPEYGDFYGISLADHTDAQEGVLRPRVAGGRTVGAVRRKEVDVPRPRRRRAEAETAERKALLAADQKANALARRERREETRTQNAEAQRTLRKQEGYFHEQQLRVGLRSNKLHAKGFDGEGRVN